MNLLQQIANNKNCSKPVIYGVSGLVLSDEEKYFFSKNGCVGFILFSRNIENKEQLKNLVKSLKELMQSDVLILIDQEGGRVARLKEPHFKCYPAAEFFAEIYKTDKKKSVELLKKNYQEIANDLVEMGINVDCAPVLDLSYPQTHLVIGNRAFGSEVLQVAELGMAVCEALLSKNVYPVIKHIPGHGRATCDSHLELPRVEAPLQELIKTDFAVFKHFAKQKFAMTAHILYSFLDDQNCATLSKKAIDFIRNEIGFKNILMSDDLSMKALGGSFASRAQKTIEAGCDLILHCNGNMQEMQEINQVLPKISQKTLEKFC